MLSYLAQKTPCLADQEASPSLEQRPSPALGNAQSGVPERPRPSPEKPLSFSPVGAPPPNNSDPRGLPALGSEEGPRDASLLLLENVCSLTLEGSF